MPAVGRIACMYFTASRIRNGEGRVCEVGRFERVDVIGDSVEDARDCRRFDGLGDEVEELPVVSI